MWGNLDTEISSGTCTYRGMEFNIDPSQGDGQVIWTSSVTVAKRLGMRFLSPGQYLLSVPTAEVSDIRYREVTAEYNGHRHWIFDATPVEFMLKTHIPEAGINAGLNRFGWSGWVGWVPREEVHDIQVVEHPYHDWVPPWGLPLPPRSRDDSRGYPWPESGVWAKSGTYARYKGVEFLVFDKNQNTIRLSTGDPQLAAELGFEQQPLGWWRLELDRGSIEAVYEVSYYAVIEGYPLLIFDESEDSYLVQTENEKIGWKLDMSRIQIDCWEKYVYRAEVSSVFRVEK